jgi:prepilin-type processing-associated H-X9-DG protein/prepilin-type N-terminal cleavage/methylation domain-containing protein
MKRPAFTLIELLVVIIIILSITAILLSAVNTARNSAKAVACSANMGRLFNAMTAYESMSGTFPYGYKFSSEQPPGGYPGGSADRLGWWWFIYIGVYTGDAVGKPAVIKCPAKHLTVRRLHVDILCGNYGANLSICREGVGTKETEFRGMPLSRSDVRNPDRTVLLADSGYAIIKWHHASRNPPVTFNPKKIEDAAYIPGLSINSQRTFWPGQEKDALEGRHPGKTVNAGFVDGHVEKLPAEELLVDSKGDPVGKLGILWKPK